MARPSISRTARLALLLSCAATSATAATRTVGPAGTYAKPCAAIAAASDGDIIEIDAAGDYAGDVCQIARNGLTLRGVNGRPKIDAAGKSSGGKAIWVISGDDTTVENVEFSGATVPDANGAGIRQEGTNLTVRRCYFHDNEDGILAGDDPASEILIENSEFDHNGAGDGYSHNLYINHVKKLTFRYNHSHRAVVGHLLKSRAAETYVLYNRLTGEDGTGSYEIDVPNGGKTYVIGNLVQQGANTGNAVMLAYQEEGTNAANPSDALYVASNTFVNDRGSGTFIQIGASVTTPARLANNAFVGGGTRSSQATAVETNSYAGNAPGFVDAAHFDYRLAPGSPCIDEGADPGSAGGFSLVPDREYVHPASSEARAAVGTLDIGAYEYGNAATSGADAGAGGQSAGADAGADAGSPGVAGATSGGGAGAGGSSGGGSAAGGRTSGAPNPGGGAAQAGAPATSEDAGTSRNAADSGGCSCRTANGSPRGTGRLAIAMTTLLVGLRRAGRRRRQGPA